MEASEVAKKVLEWMMIKVVLGIFYISKSGAFYLSGWDVMCGSSLPLSLDPELVEKETLPTFN